MMDDVVCFIKLHPHIHLASFYFCNLTIYLSFTIKCLVPILSSYPSFPEQDTTLKSGEGEREAL